MKRRWKVMVILLTVFFVSLSMLDFGLMKAIASAFIKARIEKTLGAQIDFQSAQIGWLRFSAQTFSVHLKQQPIDITFNTFSAHCPTGALFGKMKGCTATFDMYQGTGKIFFEADDSFTGTLTDIQLQQHPLFNTHGIDSGRLSVSGLKGTLLPDRTEILFLFTLNDLVKSRPSFIPPTLTKLPFPVRLEPIQIKSGSANIALTLPASSSDRNIFKAQITHLLAESDLGNIVPESDLLWDTGQFKTATVLYTPSAIGLTTIKPIAQFLCPPESLTTAQPLKFTFSAQRASCQIATGGVI